MDPKPGCYGGVIVIDANSLYPSLMRHLGIFIDRCMSAKTIVALGAKMQIEMPTNSSGMGNGDLLWSDKVRNGSGERFR
jgi:DNA polymerase elongation subunit (family B)